MSELKITGASTVPMERTAPGRPRVQDPVSDFKKILGDSLSNTEKMLRDADQSTQAMIRGKQDIHETMISLEQANLSLRLLIQMRNRMMDAYNEIMRMQF